MTPGATRTAVQWRRARLVAVAVVAMMVLGAGVVAVPVVMMMMSSTGLVTAAGSSSAACLTTASAGGRRLTLDGEQLENARVIITTGAELDVPARGLVVAVATALQESTLRNINWGHLDSIGLFQQRDAWGSAAERMDPATSASMFYTGGRAGQRGLLDIAGWQSMSVTAAAQAVQRSAFPNAYAQWEALSTSLVRSVVGAAGARSLECTDAVAASLPGGAVGEMLQVALAQQGDPYVWGATGPDAFDCSGLIVYSWRQAGYRVTVRTADQMYDLSAPVEAGQEQPGDLLFGAFSGSHAGAGNAGHVMIVVRPGVAVQAPSAGRVVELTEYDAAKWRLGRLPSSALKPLQGSTTGA